MDDLEKKLIAAWRGTETLRQIADRLGCGLTDRKVRNFYRRFATAGTIPSEGRPHADPHRNKFSVARATTINRCGRDALLDRLRAFHSIDESR